MSIEPNDIINSNIKKKIFGGYDTKDVSRLLHKVAKEVEDLKSQNDTMLQQLEENRKRLQKFEELEDKMIDSINNAENARQKAIDDTKSQTSAMLANAQQRAQFIVQEAEDRAQKAMEEVQKRYQHEMDTLRKNTKMIKRDYQAIDNYSDKLLEALSDMAEKTLGEARRLKAIKKLAYSDQEAVKAQKEQTKKMQDKIAVDDSLNTNFFEDLNLD
ncbi:MULTISPECIES: DivIVA domain-containing protein [unclassified Flammeovirga]|uniref:DivIVA domain-containing protein n=1 Tax=unclassified Flammeovirga TaxID=2637820 RepID=UPI0005C5E98F|nr:MULTISPECIES: DivIVA domain-containing protein [unclassified Flammeovirga]MBD0404721.1 DivIVA domain-containing protein [Flammeovirga sp. EKP202]